MTAMTARRPYMLRAVYEWLVDNQLTPHLVVDADQPGCEVPRQFVQDGQIVLNIAPGAVGNLQLLNDRIEFNARFSGKPEHVQVPMIAINALYARENGAGTIFEEEPQLENTSPEPPPEPPTPGGKKRPSLKVVK
ncbi:ClpXP protease specificity-enhancing factor [Pseudidiomarina sp. 1APP75-27a]|nr:ClpXP protease specificity-enhancing factor [Pseudidiomarina sp. 1APP75-27a]